VSKNNANLFLCCVLEYTHCAIQRKEIKQFERIHLICRKALFRNFKIFYEGKGGIWDDFKRVCGLRFLFSFKLCDFAPLREITFKRTFEMLTAKGRNIKSVQTSQKHLHPF